jgi:hypothetical protein
VLIHCIRLFLNVCIRILNCYKFLVGSINRLITEIIIIIIYLFDNYNKYNSNNMEHWEDKMMIGLKVVKTCKPYTCRLYWWSVYQRKKSNSWAFVFSHPKISFIIIMDFTLSLHKQVTLGLLKLVFLLNVRYWNLRNFLINKYRIVEMCVF